MIESRLLEYLIFRHLECGFQAVSSLYENSPLLGTLAGAGAQIDLTCSAYCLGS
jgi:hypothetical protein